MNEKDFKAETCTVNVCTDPAYCGAKARALGHEMKDETIFRAMKDMRNGLGLKGQVMVQKTSCQGWCDYAPVVTVWPNGNVYAGLKPQDAEKFLTEVVVEGKETFDKKKIWSLTQRPEQNYEEREKNGIVNPSQKS